MGSSKSAIGSALEIPSTVLTKINKVQEKFDALQTSAEKTAEKISESFRGISENEGSGINLFIKKLQEAREAIQNLTVSNLSAEMRGLGSDSKSAADAIAHAATAFSKFGDDATKSQLRGLINTEAMEAEQRKIDKFIQNTLAEIGKLSDEVARANADFEQKLSDSPPGLTQNKWTGLFEAKNMQIPDHLKEKVVELNNALIQLNARKAELADLFRHFDKLQEKSANINDDLNKANAINEQITRLQELREKLADVNREYQELKDNRGAWNADGSDSDEAKALSARKDAIEAAIQAETEGLDKVAARQKEAHDKKLKMQQEEAAEEQRLIEQREKWLREDNLAQLKGISDQITERERAEKEAQKQAEKEHNRRQKEIEDAFRAAEAEERAREREIQAARRAYNERAKLQKKQNDLNNSTYAGGLSFAESANTINRRAQAIKYLEAARASLSTTDSNYTVKLETLNQKIDEMNKKNAEAIGRTNELNKSHSNLMNTADQLARKLALVFSVSAIQGYIRKLIEVRGEFELQNKSLEVLLQSKEKADKLFNQITNLAVKSPFTVKELTTYTKSLAAYQIKYEELYDTTKRLADVSAGLGVDMQRLILAFGQVKAANFLRGTETRQFTEAGLNILGELAKYYSELEKRIVTVGEVQERQAKRMIAFADVAEVFKRVTDEGGLFFEMQERQAETLKGMMSNLKDSIDIALNEIGTNAESTLKNFVMTIRSIATNWREVWWWLSKVIAIIGTFKAAQMIVRLGTASMVAFKNAVQMTSAALPVLQSYFRRTSASATTATTTVNAFTRALVNLKATMKSFGAGLLVSVLMAAAAALLNLVRKAQQARQEMNRFRSELEAISNNGFYEARKSASNFVFLANKITDANTPLAEQDKLLKRLQRTYADILPEQELTMESLRKLEGNYTALTDAIYAYYEALAHEQQYEKVVDEGQKKVAEATEKLINNIVNLTNVNKNEVKAAVADLRRYIEEELENGNPFEKWNFWNTDGWQSNDLLQKLDEYLIKYTGKVDGFYSELQQIWAAQGNVQTYGVSDKRLNDFVNAVKKMYEDIQKFSEETTFVQSADIERLQERYKIFLKEVAQEGNRVTLENKDNGSLVQKMKELEVTDEMYQKFFKTLSGGFVEIKEGDAYLGEFRSLMGERGLDAFTYYDNLIPLVNKAGETIDMQSVSVQNRLLEYKKAMEGVWGNEGQQLIWSFIKNYQKEGNVITKAFNSTDFLMQEGQSWTAYQSMLQNVFERIYNNMEAYKKGASALVTGIFNDEDYAEQEKLLNFTKELHKFIFGVYPEIKGANKTPEQIIQEQTNALKEANREYEKLLKYYGKEEAHYKILSSYVETFKQAGMSQKLIDDISDLDWGFDKEGTIRSLQELMKGATKEEKLLIQKAIDDLAATVELDVRVKGVEDIKNTMDELFGEYELKVELDKSGLNTNTIADLFGINPRSLDDLRTSLDKMFIEEAQKQENKRADASKTKARTVTSMDDAKRWNLLGDKQLEAYTNLLKKIDEKADREMKDRLKKYVKYLKTSVNEIVRIKLDEARQLKEIYEMKFDRTKVSETQEANIKNDMAEGVQKETNKKLDKQKWENFKETDMYLKIFEDLEYASVRSLERMREKLKELKTSLKDLDPAQLKEIMNDVKRIDDKLTEKNPFRELNKSLKDMQTARENTQNLDIWGDKDPKKITKEDIETALEYYTMQRDQAQDEADELQEIINMKEAGEEIDLEHNNLSKRALGFYKLETGMLRIMLNTQKSLVNINGNYVNTLQEDVDTTEKVRNKKQQAAAAMKSWTETAKEGANTIKDFLAGIGVELDPINENIYESVMAFAELAVEVISFGITFEGTMDSMQAAMGVIGWIMLAIQLLGKALAAIFKAKDERLKKELEAIDKQIKLLEKSAEKVKKTLENTFNMHLESNALEEYIQQQRQIYADAARGIEKQKERKKPDEDEIDEYVQKQQDALDAMEEAREQYFKNFGGFYSDSEMKSAAEEFINAWMDAFKETGDGLDALDNTFDSFWEKVVKKQMLYRATSLYLEGLFKEIDNAIGENGEVTEDEWKQIEEKWGETREGLNEFLKELAARLGIVGGVGDSSFDTLQKGIQGITEQTAQALEALLNSMRYYVSSTNDYVIRIYNALFGSGYTDNPIYVQLVEQTRYLRSIDDNLKSVVGRVGARAQGNALKVIM